MASGYTRQAAANIAAGLTIASADLNAEFNQAQSAFDITTGHDHSGSSAGTGAKILLATSVSGTLAVANGGTGVTTGTGTGSNVLSASPTFTGTITAAALTATGIIQTSAQASIFGSAAGSMTSPTSANTNLLLYKVSGTNYSGIGSHSVGDMYFVTGTAAPVTRMVIGITGLVGIGTTNPGALLHVSGGHILLDNANSIYTKNSGGTATKILTLDTDNNTYIDSGSQGVIIRCNTTTRTAITAASAGTLTFNQYGAGTLQTDGSGNVTASSDERLKDISQEYSKGLDEILSIKPIEFKWKKSSGLDTKDSYVGFSAQNVQKSLPEAIGQDSEGNLTLSDRTILAAVVRAIQELNDKVSK